MNKSQVTKVKHDIRTNIKSHNHDMAAPASRQQFVNVLDALTKNYTKQNEPDLIAALGDVSDMMDREQHNHQNESDADLVLIKRPNGHLHIANYDEAIKYFVDGYINL